MESRNLEKNDFRRISFDSKYKRPDVDLFLKLVDQYDLNVNVSAPTGRAYRSNTMVKPLKTQKGIGDIADFRSTERKLPKYEKPMLSVDTSTKLGGTPSPLDETPLTGYTSIESTDTPASGIAIEKFIGKKLSDSSITENEKTVVSDTLSESEVPDELGELDDGRIESERSLTSISKEASDSKKKNIRPIIVVTSLEAFQVLETMMPSDLLKSIQIYTKTPSIGELAYEYDILRWPFEDQPNPPSDSQTQSTSKSNAQPNFNLNSPEKFGVLTLEEVMRPLVRSTGTYDKDQTRHFLRTYRYIADSSDVAKVLFLKFFEPHVIKTTAQNQEISQMRVLNVLRKWIEYHPKDFINSTETTNLVRQFLIGVTSKLEKYTGSILGLLEQCISQASQPNPLPDKISISAGELNQVSAGSDRGFSELLKKYKDYEMMFVQLDPNQIFSQLCLLEFDLFKKIDGSEFLQQQWIKSDALSYESSNLGKMISWFNKIAYGTAFIILQLKRPRLRITALKRFIYICQKSFEHKNFNACFEILAGLNMAPISRLKKTWQALPKKYQDVWASLNQLLSSEQNFKQYRHGLFDHGQAPAIPYLGLALRDLVFAEDGNKTYIEEALRDTTTQEIANTKGTLDSRARSINIHKLDQINQIIDDISSFQTIPYNFPPIPSIQDWITKNFVIIEDQALHEMSLICEPRNKTSSANLSSSVESLKSPLSSEFPISPRRKTISMNSLKKRWRLFSS